MHTPPGEAIRLSIGPPFPADGVAAVAIFHLQVTVTDMIVVLPPPKLYPAAAVTDDARQQVYRLYHIYDRNPWVCIAPSITIAALFCVFIYALIFLVRLPPSLNCDFVATGLGLLHQLREPVHNQKVERSWNATTYCLALLQVPASPVDILETILTRKFLDSVITFTRRVSVRMAEVTVPPPNTLLIIWCCTQAQSVSGYGLCTGKSKGQVYGPTIRSSWYAQRSTHCPLSQRELTNPFIIAGHESAYRKCCAVDVSPVSS